VNLSQEAFNCIQDALIWVNPVHPGYNSPMYKGGGAAEGAVIATKIVSENPESPPQAEYISFDDITHEHLVKADQRECMASVTEEDWENFRKLNSTIDYQ